MNIVGKDLEAKGYEFLAINSQLKRNPQFVCIDKNNQRYFVIVKTGPFQNLLLLTMLFGWKPLKSRQTKQCQNDICGCWFKC